MVIKWYQKINPFFWLNMAICGCIELGVIKFAEDFMNDVEKNEDENNR